ncbi:hypothetical protein RAA17_11200 [Komagataeibacter rhaeticus]|nr:hypothetical protein [Komagataeibacter rhaeticus]
MAFADIGGYLSASSGDRGAFIGRNGTLDRPLAFSHPNGVQGRTGAGLDPCGVVQTVVTLPPGGRAEIVFLLGKAWMRTMPAHWSAIIAAPTLTMCLPRSRHTGTR